MQNVGKRFPFSSYRWLCLGLVLCLGLIVAACNVDPSNLAGTAQGDSIFLPVVTNGDKDTAQAEPLPPSDNNEQPSLESQVPITDEQMIIASGMKFTLDFEDLLYYVQMHRTLQIKEQLRLIQKFQPTNEIELSRLRSELLLALSLKHRILEGFINSVQIANSMLPPTLNDDDSGIMYAGKSWMHSAGRGQDLDWQGDVHATSTAGDYFTYTFLGEEIRFYSELSPDQGNWDIYLDDQFIRTINTYAPNKIGMQQVLYLKELNPSTPHTLKVVNKTESYWLVVDYIEVVNPLRSYKEEYGLFE